jgi:predicted DNA-binding antitoxin AbrB/MazE fold protein
MDKTMTVIYDGQVFRPREPLDLEPNAIYEITIKTTPVASEKGTLWDLLGELIGTVDAPPDWSQEHDHYIHGTPKRGQRPES